MSSLLTHLALIPRGYGPLAPMVVGRADFRQATTENFSLTIPPATIGNILIVVCSTNSATAPVLGGWTRLNFLARQVPDLIPEERTVRVALQVFAKIVTAVDNPFSLSLPTWEECGATAIEIEGPNSLDDITVDIGFVEGGSTMSPPGLVVPGAPRMTLWLAAAAWKTRVKDVPSPLSTYPGNMPRGMRSVESRHVAGQYYAEPGVAMAEAGLEGDSFTPGAFTTSQDNALALMATIGVRL